MRYLAAVILLLAGSSAGASDKDVISDAERERIMKASAIYKDDYGTEPVSEITRAINETSSRAIKKDFIVRSMQQENNQPKSILSNRSSKTMQVTKGQMGIGKEWGKQLSIKTTTNVQGLYETLIFGGYSYKVLADATNTIIN